MKKETQEWFKIAREDLQAAEHLFDKDLYRMVCYHSQQAVEKVCKAILVEKGIEVPRTHNIFDLVSAIKKLGFKPKFKEEDAIFLNSIYRSRYPSALGLLPGGEPTLGDAKKALGVAQGVVTWAQKIKSFR